jgi:hypothetical protein
MPLTDGIAKIVPLPWRLGYYRGLPWTGPDTQHAGQMKTGGAMTASGGMSERDARERNGYLTTAGRTTGQPHEIEIWFAIEPESNGRTLYLLSGGRGRSDWVRNVRRNPLVHFRAGETTYRGSARIVDPFEPVDARSREIVAAKYGQRLEAGELNNWARTSLPVVIDLDGQEADE